jgi:hypothetical protein
VAQQKTTQAINKLKTKISGTSIDAEMNLMKVTNLGLTN